MSKLLGLMMVLVPLLGCTDATCRQLTSYGDKGHIICYSGGKIIYEGDSTGKILTERESDGWFFKDAKTGSLVRVSGDCIITN